MLIEFNRVSEQLSSR